MASAASASGSAGGSAARSATALAASSAAAMPVVSAAAAGPYREGNKVWGSAADAGADASRWVVIFPHYLDSARKRSEGRKIARENAAEAPNAGEIFDCARELGLRAQLELDKAYCRDCWVPGRVRIELFDKEGAPLRPGVAVNRPELFLRIASAIPAHRLRAKNQGAAGKGSGGGGGGGGGGGAGANGKAAKGTSTTTAAKKKKKGKR